MKAENGIRYQFILGNKDGILKTWFSKMNETSGNISYICCQAIEYYANTGKYLCIGKIGEVEKLDSMKKNIYIRSGSQTSELIKEWTNTKEHGPLQTFLKQILTRSILYNQQQEYFPEQYEELQEITVTQTERYIPATKTVEGKVSPPIVEKPLKKDNTASKAQKQSVGESFMLSLLEEELD